MQFFLLSLVGLGLNNLALAGKTGPQVTEEQMFPERPVSRDRLIALDSDDNCARKMHVYVDQHKYAKRFCNVDPPRVVEVKSAVTSMQAEKVPNTESTFTRQDANGNEHTFTTWYVQHECKVTSGVETCPQSFLSAGMKGKFQMQCPSGTVPKFTKTPKATRKVFCEYLELPDVGSANPSGNAMTQGRAASSTAGGSVKSWLSRK